MMIIGNPTTLKGSDAWGRDCVAVHTQFVLEASDVGTTRYNYRGFGHSSFTFKAHHVGRIINVMTDDTAWTCWHFVKSDSDSEDKP